MAGLNKVILIGNLTRDPEIRYSQQGTAVCNFSIATNEVLKDQQGQKQERVEFHRIVVFGKQAETCEKYLSKGSHIYIDGKLQTRTWEKDGQDHYTTEIVVSSFLFLGGAQNGGVCNQNKHGYGNNGGAQQRNKQPPIQKNKNTEYKSDQNNGNNDDNVPF